MNKTTKIVIAAVIGLLLLIIAISYLQIKHLRKTTQIQAVELLSANDSAKAYKTKAGELYFQVNTVTVEKNALKRTLEIAGLTNKELRQKDIEKGKIISVLKSQLEASGHATTTIHDTTYIDVSGIIKPLKTFNWTNTHLSLKGEIKEKVIDMDYVYRVNLNSITESKGKNTKVTIFLDDQNAKILTGSQINIVTKKPFYQKWWFGVIVGATGGYLIAK